MSNKIIKVNSLNSKNLLNNPNMVVLDTRNKLILNNISVKLSDELIGQISDNIADNVEILGIK